LNVVKRIERLLQTSHIIEVLGVSVAMIGRHKAGEYNGMMQQGETNNNCNVMVTQRVFSSYTVLNLNIVYA